MKRRHMTNSKVLLGMPGLNVAILTDKDWNRNDVAYRLSQP
jgi:hypothetical protein